MEIYFLLGVSQPSGQFYTYRKCENANPVTGFTLAGPPKKGFAYHVAASYSFGKHWGTMLSFLTTYNDTPPLSEKELYAQQNSGLGGGSSITAMNYWAGNWRSNNLMAGLFASTNGLIRIKVKMLAGIQRITSPEVKVNGTGYYWTMAGPTFTYYTYSTTQFKSTATAFVVSGGLELQQNIWKNIFVKTSADILFSSASFNLNFSYDYNDGTANSYSGWTYSNSVTKNISFLFLSAGAGLSF